MKVKSSLGRSNACRRGFAGFEVDTELLKLVGRESFLHEAAFISAHTFLAAAIAFEMNACLTRAEKRFARLQRYAAKQALKHGGKIAADAEGKSVRGSNQGFDGIIAQESPGFLREIQSHASAIGL